MQKQIAISSLWMLGGNGLQQALQFVIFILLARYLEPAVFGYVALATVVYDIVGIVGRWGIAEVILQRRKPSLLFLSHAFIFSMVLGAILVLLVVVGTALYISQYGMTLVAELLFLLAPVALLQAAELVPEAVLRQNLDFKWLALRNNLASLAGGVFALILAIFDKGVYALVGQRFLSLVVLLVFVWVVAGKNIKFFEAKRYNLRLFRAMGSVGAHLMSGPLSGMLGPRLTDIMVGVAFGAAPLGQLKIARRIFDFVAQVTVAPLSAVAEAALPKLIGDKSELRKVYKRLQGVCALGVFPLFAGLALAAPVWVPLVLGVKWMEAIPLIQWTSLAAIPAVVNYFQSPLLIAYRQNWLISKQNVARVVSGVLLTAVGSLVGLEAVVILFVAQGYAFMLFNWLMIKKVVGWGFLDSINNIVPALLGTAGLMVSMILCEYAIQPKASWMNLALLSISGTCAYFAVLLIGMRKESMRMLKEAIRVFSRRSV